jgi:hypothetical protein
MDLKSSVTDNEDKVLLDVEYNVDEDVDEGVDEIGKELRKERRVSVSSSWRGIVRASGDENGE